jgi:hypothetical protein
MDSNTTYLRENRGRNREILQSAIRTEREPERGQDSGHALSCEEQGDKSDARTSNLRYVGKLRFLYFDYFLSFLCIYH